MTKLLARRDLEFASRAAVTVVEIPQPASMQKKMQGHKAFHREDVAWEGDRRVADASCLACSGSALYVGTCSGSVFRTSISRGSHSEGGLRAFVEASVELRRSRPVVQLEVIDELGKVMALCGGYLCLCDMSTLKILGEFGLGMFDFSLCALHFYCVCCTHFTTFG